MKLFHIDLQPVKYKIDLKTRLFDRLQFGFCIFSSRNETYKFESCRVTVKLDQIDEYLICLELYSPVFGQILINENVEWEYASQSIEYIIKLPKHHSHYFLFCIRS